MEKRYFKEPSRFLDRDMEFNMYGHDGVLCLVIPCQDGKFFEWEDRGMFDVMGPWIEEGKVQFVTLDSIDWQTWSSHGPSRERMVMQENWINYIMKELIPSALEKAGKDEDEPMMVMGASMGATHAANLFFRFPDRFTRMLAMSGIYDMSPYIYDGDFDGNFYQNNPMSYLPNMQWDHPYIKKYNEDHAIFVVGQGSWENECANDLRKLCDVMAAKNIQPEVHFWGYDIPHDWPSWQRQVQIYLPELLDGKPE